MKLRRLLDGEREGARDRPPIIIFDRRILFIVEEFHRRGLEQAMIFRKADTKIFAVGSRHLMGERQTVERFGQRLSRLARTTTTAASDQEIGADFLGPNSDFNH